MFSQGGRPAKKRVRLCCVEPSFEPHVYSIEQNGDEYRQLPLTSSERFALLAQYEGEHQQLSQQEQQLSIAPSPQQTLDPWTTAVNQLRATQKELEGLIEATDLILAIAAQGDESLAAISNNATQVATNMAVVNQSPYWSLFNNQTSSITSTTTTTNTTTSSLSSSASSTSSSLQPMTPTTTPTSLSTLTPQPTSISTPSTCATSPSPATSTPTTATTKELVVRIARKHKLLELGSLKLKQKANELKQVIAQNKVSTRDSLMARKSWNLQSLDHIDYSWRSDGSTYQPSGSRNNSFNESFGILELKSAISSISSPKEDSLSVDQELPNDYLPLVLSLPPASGERSNALSNRQSEQHHETAEKKSFFRKWRVLQQQLLSKRRSLFCDELYAQLSDENAQLRLVEEDNMDTVLTINFQDALLVINKKIQVEILPPSPTTLPLPRSESTLKAPGSLPPLLEIMAHSLLRFKHRTKEEQKILPYSFNILKTLNEQYEYSVVRSRAEQLLARIAQSVPYFRFYSQNKRKPFVTCFVVYFENCVCTQIMIQKKQIYAGINKMPIHSEEQLVQFVLGRLCDKILDQVISYAFALQLTSYKSSFQVTMARERSTLAITVLPGDFNISIETKATQHYNKQHATATLDWASCWGDTVLQKIHTLVSGHAAAGLDPPGE